ncbi:unnamed protein product [Acanthosepion pharaonis]|uniref:DNA (cytosine-5-)-methyltransferase n=1 Tax=Acanthosepion pharaonis TaxID=158019 RepID=A0A812BLF6_ACAPH|nr:unnamed protein product [Sepia pharaonis]
MSNNCSFHTTSRKVKCRGDHLKDLYNQVNKGHVSYCQKYLSSSKLFESSVQSVTHEKNTSKTYKKMSNQEVTPDVFTQIQRSNKKRSSENLSVENVQMYDMHVISISPEKKNCLDLTSPSCLIADDRQLKKLQNPSLAILSLRKETAQLQKRYLCLEFGCIIWGKMSGYRPWPGLTIAGELAGKNNSPGSTWIFWFGDHKISNINNSKISRFDQKYFYNSKNFMLSKKFKNALNEALQLCAVRAGVHIKENNAQYLHSWAEKQFQELENFDHDPFAPAGDEEYPVFVLQILKKFQLPKLNDSEQTMHPQNEMSCLSGMSADKASNKVKLKNVKIQEICLCCDSLHKELVAQHPLFEGGLCQECKDFVLGTTFALDPDNSHAFCAICCHGGEVCICYLVQCGRVYCKSCIQNWVSDSAWEKILAQDPWVCFLCNTQVSVATHGCLKPKRNWNINIIQLFLSHQQLQEPDLSYLMNDPTPPPLRVLSLFDGIGTGKVALDELGIVTNGYFSSEIDLDALIVTRVNHGNNVTEIGDITQLTEKRISELCPIDLVIGGSPCNELSLVNPARKGFSEAGTGILFFEFYRVLNIVQKLCKDRHVFWLFENVTAMKSEYKAIISRYLGCQPALWDAKYFSPQQRARYFWGNIPTIYR